MRNYNIILINIVPNWNVSWLVTMTNKIQKSQWFYSGIVSKFVFQFIFIEFLILIFPLWNKIILELSFIFLHVKLIYKTYVF